jgi:hypothetical protein
MIGPGGLLLVVHPTTYLLYPVSVSWVGVAKEEYITELGCEKLSLAGSNTEHCWRCSKGQYLSLEL